MQSCKPEIKLIIFTIKKKDLEAIWRKLGREVLEANLSAVPADRRKHAKPKSAYNESRVV